MKNRHRADEQRSHQDSSAVNALVFGRRTRPGSVDPGLEEDRIRPGSIMDQPQAGMPVSAGFKQPSNGVLMGETSVPTQNLVLKKQGFPRAIQALWEKW